MITIQNLEVTFEVEDDEESERFARLFNRFIRQWAAEMEAQKARENEAMYDRSLGDVAFGETI